MVSITKQAFALVVIIVAFAKHGLAANILILGMPFYSHLAGIANVGKYLLTQGHDVRIAIPPQLKDKLQKHEVKPLLYHCLAESPKLVERAMWKDVFEPPTFFSTGDGPAIINDKSNCNKNTLGC